MLRMAAKPTMRATAFLAWGLALSMITTILVLVRSHRAQNGSMGMPAPRERRRSAGAHIRKLLRDKH